jgi:sortase A
MILFLFLQYNRILFANVEAYVSPGNIDPANIIVDPNLAVPVSSDPRLIIPKINIDVPVVYDTKPDQISQLDAMTRGVAWFGIPGANSRPGQAGNTVLSGHSSNDLFDPGDYKFIFARLDQLVAGDTFHLNYQGARYTYSVTKKEVVKPTDVQKLIYDTEGKPVVTLITCVPVGTAQSRLLVTAEQINPNPAKAAEAPQAEETESDSGAMPGNSPTLFERLFDV